MFWRLLQNYFVSLDRSQPFRMLKRIEEFRRGELDGRETLLFPWVLASSFDRVAVHAFLLVNTDLLLSNVCMIFCCPMYAISIVAFLCPQTCPWLQHRQRRFFQVVFHEKRNASHEFSVPSVGAPVEKKSSRDSLF